jgi:hypothetical protein
MISAAFLFYILVSLAGCAWGAPTITITATPALGTGDPVKGVLSGTSDSPANYKVRSSDSITSSSVAIGFWGCLMVKFAPLSWHRPSWRMNNI